MCGRDDNQSHQLLIGHWIDGQQLCIGAQNNMWKHPVSHDTSITIYVTLIIDKVSCTDQGKSECLMKR